ncbi:MAG TPA: Ig-like domain-containing protein [Acidimicrobiales bacterium]|nr:Ig-like domain-containing protein [Acidimicrobiales bacterium]
MLALALLFTATVLVAGARLLPAHAVQAAAPANGYWMVASDGGIFSFGDAGFYGSRGGQPLNKPIVGMAGTPSGRGYWFVASDGGIFTYGDAGFFGSMGGLPLNSPIVGMAATPSGNGYWLVAADGGIFTFGDAGFFGSMGGKYLFRPIVGMASTNSGNGYWFVASDGGIFSFGDATFFGSIGGSHLNEPIVGMAADPFGDGYWFVASDGGIFAFGTDFHGSMGGEELAAPVVGMAADPWGFGYWLVGSDGEIYEFGEAESYGSLGGQPLNQPVVGMAATTFLDNLPEARDDAYVTSVGTRLTAPAPGVLANDSDADGDTLGATLWDEPAHGTLEAFGRNGSFTYLPDSGFSGTDTFTYLVDDAYYFGNLATVTITVNTPPTVAVTAGPANNTDSNDATPTYSGTASDSDGSVSKVEVSVNNTPYSQVCSGSCATWSYTRSTALSAGPSHSFTFRATDNRGMLSPLVTRTVRIDTTAPTVTINQKAGQADPTNASPVEFTVVFSEAVTGFAPADLTFATGSGNTATRGTPVVTGSGTTYNVAIPLTADGTVTPTVPAAAAKDVAGNDNAASTSTDNAVAYDATRPTFDSIAATAGSPTVTATFSESLLCSTVGTGDFEATVGESPKSVTAAACTAPTDNTVEITLSEAPGTDTTVAVRALGALTDAAGNTVADTTRTVDTNDAPVLAVTSGLADDGSTNDTTPTYGGTAGDGDGTVKRVEAKVDTGEFATSGVTCTDCDTASATWSYTPLTLLGDGAHTIAFRAVDNQGGTSVVASRDLLVDTGAPGVTIVKADGQADPANTSPVKFTVTFSEAVTGFTAADVSASGAGAGAPTVTGSGSSYEVSVPVTTDGNLTASIPAGGASDAAGNTNTVSTAPATVEYDATRPDVTVSKKAGQADPTNASPVLFTVTFTEAVTGFTASDVAATGAGAGTPSVTGSGTTYEVSVPVTSHGTVTVAVPAGGASDDAANTNNGSTSPATVTYDITRPSVTVARAEGTGPTNDSPVEFTVTFNEAVTGFDAADDVAVGGGAANGAATVSSTSTSVYKVTVPATGEGDVTLAVLVDRASDAAGNKNTASNTETIPFDNVDPAFTAVTATSGSKLATAMFREPVLCSTVAAVDFTAAYGTTPVVVEGVDCTGTEDDTIELTFASAPTPSTVVSVTLVGVVTDEAGNIAAVPTTKTDTTNGLPTLTVTEGPATATNSTTPTYKGTAADTDGTVSAVLVGIDSAEPSAAGVTCTGCPAASPTWSYTPTTALTPGTYNLTFVAVDNDGQATDPAVTRAVTVDQVAPSVTIAQKSDQADPTTAATVKFTVTFSEDVSGFDATDVTVAGAAHDTPVVSGTGAAYEVSVTLTEDGTVTASIAAGGAADAATNPNTASPDTGDRSVTYDGTKPAFESVSATNGSTTVVPVFSEALDCATATSDDFAVTVNGVFTPISAAPCTDGAVALTVGTAPTPGQTVRVTLIGEVADTAGNEADAPVSHTVVTNQLPTLSITAGPADDSLTNNASPTYSGTATDGNNKVKQVEVKVGTGEFSTAGVTCTNCGTQSATWSWTPTTPLASGSYTFVFRAVDELDEASATRTRDLNVDLGRPGVTVEQSSAGDPTNVSPVTYAVTFTEDVTGFGTDDLDFTGTTATLGVVAIDSANAPAYTVTVPVTGDGVVLLQVLVDKVTDDAGNGNDASTSADRSVTYDDTPPTFDGISAPAADPNVVAHFSEAMLCSTIDDDDFAITVGGENAVVTAVSCSGNDATLTLSETPQDGDQVVINLTGTVTDLAGNVAAPTQRSNDSSLAPAITVDASSPADNARTNDTTPTYTGTASDLDGLVTRVMVSVGTRPYSTAGVVCTNCNTASATWSYTPTAPLADGTHTFRFMAVDDATVTSPAATRTLVIENVRPTVTVTGPARSNAETVTLALEFTEDVTGIAADDIELSGTAFQVEALRKAEVTSVDARHYNVAITGMTREGTIVATVKDGAGSDVAGNTSTASSPFTVVRDTTDPTVTVTQKAGQADPTKDSPVNFVVTFNEVVVGFTAADLTVSGNSAAPTITPSGNASVFEVAVPVTASGPVTLSIGEGVATDEAGNDNAASSGGDESITYDVAAPSVSVAADDAITSGSAAEFTVTFSEAVTGFGNDDLVLGGGATRGTPSITSTDNIVFDVSVPVTADGTVTLTVAANAAKDVAGNDNTAALETPQVTVERTAPTVTITGPVRTKAATVTFTLTFSEDVTGIANDDITVEGTAFNATSLNKSYTVSGADDVYTLDVTGMDKDGTIVVSVAAGAGTDAAGNGNTAGGPFTATRDTDGPAVSVEQAADQADPTNGSSVKYAIAFGEKVTGLTVADLDTTGSIATLGTPTLTGSDANYTVTIPVSGEGEVKLSLAAGAAVDEAGNGSDASTSTDNTVTRDSVGPATSVAAVDASENGSSARFTVTFAEDVTDFDDVPGDLTLTGNATRGTPTITQGADAKTYDVAVPVTTDGTVILEVPAGVAVDGAGNGNLLGAAQTVTVDRDVPTPTITGAARTKASPIVFTVTFDEPVSGFTKEDVTVSGTAFSELALMKDHSVTGDDDTYTVSVTGMNQDGTVVVSVAAGAAEDGSGNASSAAGPFTTVRDTTAPTVTVDQATGQADPTNVASAEFKVVFTEKAVGFVVGDIQTSGPAGTPTLTPVGTDGTEFKVVVPITGDGAVTATVPAGVATDEAGNANAASTGDNSVTYDGTRPDFTTVGGQVGRTTVTANFSEAVVCTSAKFAASFNKTVSGTTTTRPQSVTSVACSGTVATLTLSGSPTEGERVAVTLVSGVADAVGNTAASETVVSPTLSGGATPATETNPLPTYTGSATGGLPGVNVAKVEVKIDNGTPSDADVTCPSCGTPSATWSWQPDLPMLPGNRTITFIVTNAGGSTMEIVRSVTVL